MAVQKEGYVTHEAEWTFSGRRIDDQSACLERVAAPAAVAYVGCYAERHDVDVTGLTNRDLDGHIFSDPAMTTGMCVDTCAQLGFGYAGTQYGQYCFCGNEYGRTGEATNCDMRCAGDPSQIFGGGHANGVYRIR